MFGLIVNWQNLESPWERVLSLECLDQVGLWETQKSAGCLDYVYWSALKLVVPFQYWGLNCTRAQKASQVSRRHVSFHFSLLLAVDGIELVATIICLNFLTIIIRDLKVWNKINLLHLIAILTRGLITAPRIKPDHHKCILSHLDNRQPFLKLFSHWKKCLLLWLYLGIAMPLSVALCRQISIEKNKISNKANVEKLENQTQKASCQMLKDRP